MREIRDPVHVFIRFEPDECAIVDSSPYQRLRHIHQLALTCLVYPGATHRRFEHCLGVMEVATRIYDVVTKPSNIRHQSVRDLVPETDFDRAYWRRVVRAAALCHDLGHLPFSHAAEHELLPAGMDHEQLSLAFIQGDQMRAVWDALHVDALDVARIALGKKTLPSVAFSEWQEIVAEIITGDIFGADRIDYLLRDSHHIGVAYGRFDHHRLIDTIRILPMQGDSSEDYVLGIERGGLESAEALLWARYQMFSQVYFHKTRRIYDHHLVEFLQAWLPGGRFDPAPDALLRVTDVEVTAALRHAAIAVGSPGHVPACRIIERGHFREVYAPTSGDRKSHLDPAAAVYEALQGQFGVDAVWRDLIPSRRAAGYDFPVYPGGGRMDSSLQVSPTLANAPTPIVDRVYADPTKRDEIRSWIDHNLDRLLQP